MVVYSDWPRLGINFDNTHAVFVVYPWGAGGKFVINCLAVSARAVLQDDSLARQQFFNDLTPQQKQNLVLTRLAAEHGRWQDLHLGTVNLTGIKEHTYVRLRPHTAQYWPWIECMHELSRSTLVWFMDFHDAGHLEAALRVWHQARVVRFVNTDQFLEFRGVRHNQQEFDVFWQTVRDPSWPMSAPTTWQEFSNLDPNIQKELLFVRHGDIFRYIMHPAADRCYRQNEKQHLDQVCTNREVFEFDAECLLNADRCLDTMRSLYQWIDLHDFDKDFIECYHKQWLEKIQAVPL
jgi:hypothetical protein